MTFVPWCSIFRAHPALKRLGLCFLLFLLFGCSPEGNSGAGEKTQTNHSKPVRLVYVDWASEQASTHVVQAVIEKRLGRECHLLEVSLLAMWQALAAGDQDASVAAWLPSLHGKYLQKYSSEVVNLGPNLKGTRIGLVVPEYVPLDSIAQLPEQAEKLEHKIIGIDPHAGLMDATQQAINAYSLDSFELVPGSGPTMTTALGQAIRKREWIVVTGWTPHWKFARWDLKYLKDPRHVYGDTEHIATIARMGLKKDMPRVYAFLDNFFWSPADMAEVMLKAKKDKVSYAQAAREWIRENKAQVTNWLNQQSNSTTP